ncbi:cupin domain-containing protein [Chryseolinea soli]|uniref:Carboxymuconolactone decarboxylase n=1 Tax=Chryseolinea soli TaxID=2321403 RepID=A0A385SXE7_9BACT|nr:cupin domain-containing protein [Chryseolinea soli]AYB35316.1 carboxymuconolactone decarboxylase [Chryseolinea soli]
MRQRPITLTFLVFLSLLVPCILIGQSKQNSQSLSDRQQAIALVAAFTAKGDLEKLKEALHSALDANLTMSETKEIVVHVYAYAGFPRSIRGLNTLMSVLDERKAKGIKDAIGREATPVPNNVDKYEVGRKTLEALTGRPQGELSGYNAFSPEIDKFLKEHLFADIFGRDILTYAERELATVSALTSLGGVEPMLQSHMQIAIRQGISAGQLVELLALFEKFVGKTEAESARKVFAEISGAKISTTSTSDEIDNKPIFSKGQKNPNPNMVGTVWLYSMVEADSLSQTQVGNVTFERGARTNWHSHYAGQILLVTDGMGYHQIKGKPVELIKKGDVIKCPPNVEHWHGATPDHFLTHIAITQNTEKGRVTWLRKVTDEEYNAYALTQKK